MSFTRPVSGIAFCKGLVCSVLLEHPALHSYAEDHGTSARGTCTSAASVLSVLLCKSCVLMPQYTETAMAIWWKATMNEICLGFHTSLQ